MATNEEAGASSSRVIIRQATTIVQVPDEETRNETHRYTFFNPNLREERSRGGNIYDDERLATSREAWAIQDDSRYPYLRHVKSLSANWPVLGLLADFMEVGTSPMRWETLKRSPAVRVERASRTEVTQLDYLESGSVSLNRFRSSRSLKASLEYLPDPTAGRRNFRLFIVEDLSRDVIEILGSQYDIEPHFFREHLFDYAWYNTRDRWVYPPRLQAVTRKQRWIQLRFPTARYFQSSSTFRQAAHETEGFNVLRRCDDDTNSRAIWDEKDSKIGLVRSRASFWQSSQGADADARIGILLVDPTIKTGFPLWNSFGNWEETPSMHDSNVSPGHHRQSLYEKLIHSAQRPQSLRFATTDTQSFPHLPVLALLRLVASEWLIISEYIKTRLGQIEWEIYYPEHFLERGGIVDTPLRNLHAWRRLVPLYQEMLTESLQNVFRAPFHPVGDIDSPNTMAPPAGSSSQTSPTVDEGMKGDFARTLEYMEKYLLQIDRLSALAPAIITISDIRDTKVENRNLARLTWLATFFIPLTFVTGLFSMTEDVRGLRETFKWFAAIGIPVAFISIGQAAVMALPWKRINDRLKRWYNVIFRGY